MATMNISLADPLKEFVDEEVREGGYSSASDYMCDLIQRRQHDKAATLLRQLIAEGVASGPATPVTPDCFDRMREGLRQHFGEKSEPPAVSIRPGPTPDG